MHDTVQLSQDDCLGSVSVTVQQERLFGFGNRVAVNIWVGLVRSHSMRHADYGQT